MIGDLGLAVVAGMLAAVNPCGFALLPGYLGLVIGTDTTRSRRAAVARALVLSAWMTLGFVVVFGVFGVLVLPLAAGIQQYLPWVTLVAGIGLALLGGWLLAGRSLPTGSLPFAVRRWGSPVAASSGRGRGASPVPVGLGYGIVYALASLTCTIGPFLAIVVSSLRSASAGRGLALFLAYAGGMALVVATAAVAVALGRTVAITVLRRSGRWAGRIAGGIMVVVGAYVAYYGAWEIRVLAGGGTDDPVVGAAIEFQQALAALVSRIGPVPIALALLVVAGAVVVFGRRVAVRRKASVGLER